VEEECTKGRDRTIRGESLSNDDRESREVLPESEAASKGIATSAVSAMLTHTSNIACICLKSSNGTLSNVRHTAATAQIKLLL
jgi:hypothetical protein